MPEIKGGNLVLLAVGTHDDEAGSSRPKRSRQYETVEEAMLPRVHHEFLQWGTSKRDAKTRYNTKLAHLIPKQIYSPSVVDWKVLNDMGCAEEIEDMLEIKVYEAGSQEKIFTSEAWRRLFDINESIYTELCHKFYSTYDFDEVCDDDELRTKKLIKFILCGRAHSLTLIEFARRIGLYRPQEINEEGFNVYFQGGLRSDENFNARDYWLSITSDEEFHLSRILTSRIRSPIMWVLQKMITYGVCQRTIGYDKIQRNELWLMSMFEAKHQKGNANVAWLMAKWLKRKGVGSQRDNMICCGQFITKMAKKMRLMTNEVLNGLSALTYCRNLDTTTLRS